MDVQGSFRELLLQAMPPNERVTRDELLQVIFAQIDEALAHLVGSGAVEFVADRLGEPHLDLFCRLVP
jgi:hypothetical protein